MAEILIVEDESIISMNAEMFLTAEGHNVIGIVNNGPAALKLLKTSKPDLILMDIVLKGDINGTETTKLINEQFSDIPVAYMTAHTDAKTKEEIAQTDHIGILFKPFDILQLQEIINKATEVT